MDKSDIENYSGCIFFICIFAIFVILFRWWDAVDESKSQRYKELMDQIAEEPSAEKAIVLFNEAYENATSRNEKRKAKSGVIVLNEQLGNYSIAHHLLDEFIKEFESSKFTDIHRALLYGKEGLKEKAIAEFESILKEKKEFKESGIIKRLWNNFTDSESSDSQLANFYGYFFDYVCNMVAIDYESYLINDSIKRLKNKERLFLLNPQIDDAAQSYIDYKTNYPNSSNLFEAEKLEIMQKMHLGLWPTSVSTEKIIEDIYRMKWNYTTRFLMEHDEIYGYQATKNKMNTILKNNHTTSEKYPKFLIDAYLSLGQSDNISSITYDIFRTFHKDGFAFLVKLTPQTFFFMDSSLIKAGITNPRILLHCNDWDFSHGNIFLSDSVAKYKGSKKHLVLLSDEYKLDTIDIDTEKLGAIIEHVIVPSALFDMLVYDFSDSSTPKDSLAQSAATLRSSSQIIISH